MILEGYLKNIEKKEIYVAEFNHKIVGFIHFNSYEIFGLFVQRDYQKIGVGKELVHKFFSKNSDKSDFYVESTLNAQNFYKKMGFTKVEESFVIKLEVKVPIIKMEIKKS